MRYKGGEALGLIETVGMVPVIEAADKMLKAADVELIAYENVGSTLVTIMVKGDVAAVKSSVEAGAAAAAAIGKLTAKNVMPRPIRAVGDVVSIFPKNVVEWMKIPERFLATAVNGKVFFDERGEFSRAEKCLRAFTRMMYLGKNLPQGLPILHRPDSIII